MFERFRGRHVLLLQGPLGPFFRYFARDLEAHGAKVTKLAFNAGDALYYLGTPYRAYRGTLEAWPDFFEAFCTKHEVDTVFLLGDMRPYHRPIASAVAAHGIDLFVFEEGYLRPNFITLESGGVNGNSRMPKDAASYVDAGLDPKSDEVQAQRVFGKSAILTSLYYVAYNFFCFLYPFYRHHRDSNALKHGLSWVRSGLRKLRFRYEEDGILEDLRTTYQQRYFFVPLQVWNDFQWKHSPFQDTDELLEYIISSFAAHADPEHRLVVKHHIADRGYRDYTALIDEKRRRFGLGERLIYVHDLHLPTLLQHARGTVVMNSTVGLSSLHHG
ncbi:MAG: capsule biosynthesis protein, partial [Nannocystaceae bacterium]